MNFFAEKFGSNEKVRTFALPIEIRDTDKKEKTIMYAIVEILGQQFKVTKDQKIFVHRLQNEEGSEVVFDTVMLKDSDGNVQVGAPKIEGASVKATILKHLKGDKVLVFKKKRRKGYQKMNGHRQYLSQIQITEIV